MAHNAQVWPDMADIRCTKAPQKWNNLNWFLGIFIKDGFINIKKSTPSVQKWTSTPHFCKTTQKGKRKNIFSPHFGCKAKLPASKWVQLQVSLIIGNSEDFNFVIDYVFCVMPWRPTIPYENDKQVRQTHSARGRMKNKWDKLTQLKAEWKTSETEEHAFSAEAIVRVLCLWNARLAIGGISRLFHTNSYILVLERYWPFSFKGC